MTTPTWADALRVVENLERTAREARSVLLDMQGDGLPAPFAVSVDYRPEIGDVAVGIHGRSTTRYLYMRDGSVRAHVATTG